MNAAATNALGTGSLEVDTAGGNVSLVDAQQNQTVTALSGTVAGAGSATVKVEPGKMLTINQPAGTPTFAGTINLALGATAGTGGVLAKSGAGTETLTGVPVFGNNSVLQVSSGSLKFAATTGTPNVGTGVVATISGTGSVELAGSVSVLGVATPVASRVNVSNTSSSATGLLVSAGNHQVGGIDGTGTTQVNDGASLTANHIIQGALVIGTAGSSASLVTIDASDASGNPLLVGGGGEGALTGSLAPSTPFGADAPASSGLLAANDSSSSSGTSGLGASVGGGSAGSNSSVPEPSTVVMLLIAAAGSLVVGLRRRGRQGR